MSEPLPTLAPAKDALEFVRYELNYRREKQWNIFSWTVTMLLAVIGGIVTLASRGDFKFAVSLRAIMVIALVAIARYAVKWVNNNIEFESLARGQLVKFLKHSGIDENAVPDPSKAEFGYPATITLVATGAVLAVLFAPPSPWRALLTCVDGLAN
jgi:hypothetical protein